MLETPKPSRKQTLIPFFSGLILALLAYRINFPNEYVSPDGDVYVRFESNNDTLETTIDTFGITLVLQQTDGSIEVHGITP